VQRLLGHNCNHEGHEETAAEKGIDLDSLDTEEVVEEERLNEEITENHECCHTAKIYGEMVDNWFQSAEDLFEKNEDEPNLKMQFGITNVYPFEEPDPLEEAVQVIRWYQHQIYVKLMRAIRGKMEEKTEIMDDYAKDSDGSAKISLIALDRSIAAWGEIHKHLPLHDNNTIDILTHLDRLRRKVEKVFPDARAFIRPGFDKIDLNS